nr:ATP-binding protein [Streptomyces sp. NBC_00974]WSX54270.1 ATP-binding protein [Streptomyces sp. NBC_00974]
MTQTITPLLTAAVESSISEGQVQISDTWTVTFAVSGHAPGEPVPVADAQQVRGVRRIVAARLAFLGLGCLQEALLLIVSEIVTNAVEHAGGPGGGSVQVAQRLGGGRLITEVCDSGRGRPRMGIAGAEEENGRGLFLVDSLTTELGGTWGFDLDRRAIWVEIPTP